MEDHPTNLEDIIVVPEKIKQNVALILHACITRNPLLLRSSTFIKNNHEFWRKNGCYSKSMAGIALFDVFKRVTSLPAVRT